MNMRTKIPVFLVVWTVSVAFLAGPGLTRANAIGVHAPAVPHVSTSGAAHAAAMGHVGESHAVFMSPGVGVPQTPGTAISSIADQHGAVVRQEALSTHNGADISKVAKTQGTTVSNAATGLSGTTTGPSSAGNGTPNP